MKKVSQHLHSLGSLWPFSKLNLSAKKNPHPFSSLKSVPKLAPAWATGHHARLHRRAKLDWKEAVDQECDVEENNSCQCCWWWRQVIKWPTISLMLPRASIWRVFCWNRKQFFDGSVVCFVCIALLSRLLKCSSLLRELVDCSTRWAFFGIGQQHRVSTGEEIGWEFGRQELGSGVSGHVCCSQMLCSQHCATCCLEAEEVLLVVQQATQQQTGWPSQFASGNQSRLSQGGDGHSDQARPSFALGWGKWHAICSKSAARSGNVLDCGSLPCECRGSVLWRRSVKIMCCVHWWPVSVQDNFTAVAEQVNRFSMIRLERLERVRLEAAKHLQSGTLCHRHRSFRHLLDIVKTGVTQPLSSSLPPALPVISPPSASPKGSQKTLVCPTQLNCIMIRWKSRSYALGTPAGTFQCTVSRFRQNQGLNPEILIELASSLRC